MTRSDLLNHGNLIGPGWLLVWVAGKAPLFVMGIWGKFEVVPDVWGGIPLAVVPEGAVIPLGGVPEGGPEAVFDVGNCGRFDVVAPNGCAPGGRLPEGGPGAWRSLKWIKIMKICETVNS
jgi:hypothetical protein